MALKIDQPPRQLDLWELPDQGVVCTGKLPPVVRSHNVQHSTSEWDWQADLTATDSDFIVVSGRLTFRSPSDAQRLFTFAYGPAIVDMEGPRIRLAVDDIPSQLKDRLDHFEFGFAEAEPVSETTRIAMNDLVSWLSSNADTVSLTVSNVGMISIAAVFPREVRLYVETARDGNSEAAVTRERRYALDIPVGDIADLTPEAIRAAIGSI